MTSFRNIIMTTLAALALMAAALPATAAEIKNPQHVDFKISDNQAAAFLLVDDKAILGLGHAALLVGDENGWDYFSFAPDVSDKAQKNNLMHLHFQTLADARSSKDLARYDEELCWTTTDDDKIAKVRDRILKQWDHSQYNAITRNCFHMAADGLKAGSFNIDGNFVAPVSAYAANETNATSHGAWPVLGAEPK